MRMQEVSSEMMVPKLRVLRPEDEVSVLADVSWEKRREGGGLLSVHRVADPDHRVTRRLHRCDVAREMGVDLDAIREYGKGLGSISHTFPAPYRVMRVTLPLCLSGLTTDRQ